MPTIRYEFRDDKPLGFRNPDKADAQAIGEALQGIAVERGGQLKPEDVVAAAADRRSYLSQFFTWDEAEAAKAWRLTEARALIRSVEVIEVDAPNDQRRRAWLSIADTHGRSYRAVQHIEADPRLQLLVMEQAIRDLRIWRRRYRELNDICGLISVAEAGIEARMGDAAPRLE